MENNICQSKMTPEQLTTFAEKMPIISEITTTDTLTKNGEESGITIKNTGNLLKQGFVYLITNKVNGKRYIGITIRDIYLRFREHIWDAINKKHNCILFAAIRKYGKENFTIELIEEVRDITDIELLHKESEYITKYNTLVDNGNGYNMVLYEDRKLVFSKESRKKMSVSHLGKQNGFYGCRHSEDSKRIMGEHSKLRNHGIRNPFYGKTHDEVARRKISTGNRKYLKTHPHSRMGKTFTPESIAKMKTAHQGRWVGEKNGAYDHEIVTFQHTITGEIFRGTGWEFTSHYNHNRGCVSELKNGKRSHYKGWILSK